MRINELGFSSSLHETNHDSTLRFDEVYQPENQPSCIACAITYNIKTDDKDVKIIIKNASVEIREHNKDRITVLVSMLAHTPAAIVRAVKDAIIVAHGKKAHGRQFNPQLAGGMAEILPGFNGFRFHHLVQNLFDD